MNALIQSQLQQSQIFFFISSIGFVFLWILVAIFLVYLIRATNALSKMLEKVEKDVDAIGDTTKEMVEDIKENIVRLHVIQKIV